MKVPQRLSFPQSVSGNPECLAFTLFPGSPIKELGDDNILILLLRK
jgi:hypothetical protein